MWLIGVAGALVLGAVLWGPLVSNVEQPKYTVVESDGIIDIRDYPAMIVAEAEVSSEREKAINQGFRLIAGYIFGNNLSSQKVAMTAPVTQEVSITEQTGEKIAMTAPVTQQGAGSSWKVRFIMPASYTMESLPKPRDPKVQLSQIASRRFTVIRFSGMAGEASLQRQTARLTQFIAARKLTAVSAPRYAFYNPPWTLPFMRRNEVMIEISR